MRARIRLLVVVTLVAGFLPLGPEVTAGVAHGGIVSDDPVDWTPHILDNPDGSQAVVKAILPLGNRIVVGGSFSQVRESGRTLVMERRNLFAFDATTGAVDPLFAPSVAGTVEALLASPDGRHVFVGGRFSRVNGSVQRRLAKLDAATGQPVAAFSPEVDGAAVLDLALAGDRLVVAGSFTAVNGQGRVGLAAVDPATGSVDPDLDIPFTDPRQGPVSRVEKFALTPDGRTLVAVGNFTRAAGQRRHQIAVVDLASRPARLTGWQTDRFSADDCSTAFDTYMRDVDTAPDGSWFAVVTTGSYRRDKLCDTASRWELGRETPGQEPTWVAHSGGDSFTGVGVTGAAVYVGGHMRWMNVPFPRGTGRNAEPGPGAILREGIAALDTRNGMPLSWNPGRSRGEGAWALVPTPDGLWVGSDTSRLGGEFHGRIGFFPLAGGFPLPPDRVGSLPGSLYVAGLDGRLLGRSFDGTVAGLPAAVTANIDWSDARGVFMVDDNLYSGWRDGRLLVRSFDGDVLGPPAALELHGLDHSHFPIADVTGMFFDQGRLYYTVSGKQELYYRYFTPESRAVGTETFVAAGSGVNWKDVRGLTLAGGQLYHAAGGDLQAVAFEDGRVRGSPRLVLPATSGPWSGRGLFLLPGAGAGLPPPPTTTAPGGGSAAAVPPGRSGYWMVGADGAVYAFGGAAHHGNARPGGGATVVDLEPTATGNGYWIVDSRGAVSAFGDAAHLGNADPGGFHPGETVTSLSATPTGAGYWIFTTRGRALRFGDATHHGDMSGTTLNGPVLDSVPTPSGRGYYMVASDGGVFAFGDAGFAGSMGGVPLNAPVQSLVPDGDGAGYWLVASDGGVFAFDAPFRGSMGAVALNRPVTGMVRFGDGYLMVGQDGGIFNFSTRPFHGSLGANPPARPIVSVAALE